MSLIGSFTKQPAEVESYTIDYTQDLTDGDGVIASAVVIHPDDALVVRATDVNSDRVRVWLEGGEDGERYKVEVTSSTADGRVMQDEFILTVRDF